MAKAQVKAKTRTRDDFDSIAKGKPAARKAAKPAAAPAKRSAKPAAAPARKVEKPAAAFAKRSAKPVAKKPAAKAGRK